MALAQRRPSNNNSPRVPHRNQRHIPVKLEVNAKAMFTPDTGSFNIVGEIPGSDPRLEDEVVMLARL